MRTYPLLSLLAFVPPRAAQAEALEFEGVRFSRNVFPGEPSSLDVFDELQKWGYYDEAASWAAKKLAADQTLPFLQSRVNSERSALLALTTTFDLPADTFPMVETAEQDLDGDRRPEKLVLFCRKSGQPVVPAGAYGFPLPEFLRVIGSTFTTELRVNEFCAPRGRLNFVPMRERTLIEVAVLSRGDWKEYFDLRQSSLTPVMMADSDGKESRVLGGKGGGASWWAEGILDADHGRFVHIQGKNEDGRRLETREAYSWDGRVFQAQASPMAGSGDVHIGPVEMLKLRKLFPSTATGKGAQPERMELLEQLEYHRDQERRGRWFSIVFYDRRGEAIRTSGKLAIMARCRDGFEVAASFDIRESSYIVHYGFGQFDYLRLLMKFPDPAKVKCDQPRILLMDFADIHWKHSTGRPEVLVAIEGSTVAYKSATDYDSLDTRQTLTLEPRTLGVKAGEPVSVLCRLRNDMQRRLQIVSPDSRLKETQSFAFIVRDALGRQLATVYPESLFVPSMLTKYGLLRTPGLELPPGTQLGRVFEPGDGPDIEFDLLRGGTNRGWNGRIPGLSEKGDYTVTAIYSQDLFGRWFDGMRGITLSNPISVKVE